MEYFWGIFLSKNLIILSKGSFSNANKCFGDLIFVISSAKYPCPPAPRAENKTVLHLGLFKLSSGVSSKYMSLIAADPSIP